MQEDEELTKKVLAILPIDGSEMRQRDIAKEGENREIIRSTVQKKLRILTERGDIIRREKSPKNVSYRRRGEIDRIETLTDDFLNEVRSSINDLMPQGLKIQEDIYRILENTEKYEDLIKLLHADSLTLKNQGLTEFLKSHGAKIDKFEETKKYYRVVVKYVLLHSLKKKVLRLLNESIPNEFKDMGCYVIRWIDPKRVSESEKSSTGLIGSKRETPGG